MTSLVQQRLLNVIERVRVACVEAGRDPGSVRLIAVSKTKEDALIEACFQKGQLYFGENYVQELVEKAGRLPQEIRWHFIGVLQNQKKARELVKLKNLHMIETVHSLKAASELDKAMDSSIRRCVSPLPILVQVNTSREQSKSGVVPEECLKLVDDIVRSCAHLKFSGLMTIGNPNPDPGDQNCDFKTLAALRSAIYSEFPLYKDNLELSMGMSLDFPQAIKYGSTSVRVGSEIFGERKQD